MSMMNEHDSMNDTVFALAAQRIRETAGEDERYFHGMTLRRWSEERREVTIQFESEYNIKQIRERHSHAVVGAFERLLGEPVTVICTTADRQEPLPPHERFKILTT